MTVDIEALDFGPCKFCGAPLIMVRGSKGPTAHCSKCDVVKETALGRAVRIARGNPNPPDTPILFTGTAREKP